MARTRSLLVEKAYDLYVEYGYDDVTIERIVAEAGFSRGAFYAHFSTKEAIFFEVINFNSSAQLSQLLLDLRNCETPREMILVLCSWTENRSLKRDVSYLFVDLLQSTGRAHGLSQEHKNLVRENWNLLGSEISRFSRLKRRPEELGALVMLQIADGPFVEEAGGPKAGELLRMVLEPLFGLTFQSSEK